MPGDVNVAAVASVLADPTRAMLLSALLDGRAWPASDLARTARIAPSTASHHLNLLVELKWLRVEKQGRHRYFQLADARHAEVLEHLGGLAPVLPVHSLRESEAGRALRAARLCYNHFAGEFGVALARALVEKEVLAKVDGGYLVTRTGELWVQEAGLPCEALKKQEPFFAPHHIDWSERTHHLAGALGVALARRFLDQGWVKRVPNSRAVCLTEPGQEALHRDLGIRLSPDREAITA